jgi:hypothetical protein
MTVVLCPDGEGVLVHHQQVYHMTIHNCYMYFLQTGYRLVAVCGECLVLCVCAVCVLREHAVSIQVSVGLGMYHVMLAGCGWSSAAGMLVCDPQRYCAVDARVLLQATCWCL